MYYCKYCKKEFKDKGNLRRHEKYSHEVELEKIECSFCKNLYSKCGIKSHIDSCKLNPDRIITKEELRLKLKTPEEQPGECCFCRKLCKNQNSLRNHQRFCKLNPYKDIPPSQVGCKRSKPAWNKGLTKETDERVRLGTIKSQEKVKEYYSTHQGTFKGKHHSADTKEKLREIALQNEHEKHFRCRVDITYNGYRFQSTYELQVAKDLDKHHIKWIQPERVPYRDINNNLHYYTADFYLPEYDVYLDPKNNYLINNVNPYFGYKDVDKIRWVQEQNNIRIIILDENHLMWSDIHNLIG